MNLVFAKCDITPEQWNDFARTASRHPLDQNAGIVVPYALVYSLFQEILERTPKIDATAKTQLGSATWEEIKGYYLAHFEASSIDFLILDQQSFEDRTVVIIEKGAEYAKEKSRLVDLAGPYQTKIVWKRYRAPFEEAWVVICGIEGFCGTETAERYFEVVVEKEDVDGEQAA